MLDKSQFALLSGSQALACLDTGDFETVRNTMEARLLVSLCMSEAPAEDDANILLWDQLLADALAISVLVKQDEGIKSESMRNYSYTLADYANSWRMLHEKSGDLLALFNVCDSGVTFQTNLAGRIYGHRHHYYGCSCHECV